MKKTGSSVDSATEQSRVSWGKFVRAQHLQPERPSVSSPELEYVINYKAPLPSPAVLMDYDLACPGTADRIVSLLEQQVIHQREIETKKVVAEIARANKRESFSYVTRVVAFVGGFILLLYGKNIAGAITFIATFAEIVGTSVVGKIRQAKTHQKNLQQMINALEVSPVDYPSKPDNEEAKGGAWG